MNGPDHYREAERHLNAAQEVDDWYDDASRYHLEAAQVHATLALAAATAANIRRNGALPVDAHTWAPITAVAQEPS